MRSITICTLTGILEDELASIKREIESSDDLFYKLFLQGKQELLDNLIVRFNTYEEV